MKRTNGHTRQRPDRVNGKPDLPSQVVVVHHANLDTLAGDSIRFFEEELARATRERDAEVIEYCQSALREFRNPRKGPIDVPLFPLKRSRSRKPRKSSKRA